MQTGRLAGQCALVTGAGRGLGYAVARGLAAHGARVLAVARGAQELAELAREIRADGGEIATRQADLADGNVIETLARDALNRFGRFDTLINNAAVLRTKPFRELTAAEFEHTLAVNLLAPVRLTRALLPTMVERRRGAIINVTSAAGNTPYQDEVDYCASKYGLEGFSLALALELDGTGVGVNLLAPGMAIKPTSLSTAEFNAWPPERRAEYRDPADMVDAFVWLADAPDVTGQRFDGFELAELVHRHGWGWRPAATKGA
jgi:NAD(P)-dependent dehydrogenase (short-subunit alcohol dehydrogenase family)